MKTEIWKDIQGYEGLYQVSNLGQVKTLTRKIKHGDQSYYKRKERILKGRIQYNGYILVGLHKDKKQKVTPIHRLVAEAFIPNSENKSTVNHKDGDKTNNCVDNLEWATHRENTQHAWKNGLQKMTPKRKKQNQQAACKKIVQYDKFGNYIKIWDSQSQAARALNIRQTVISNCCLGIQKTGKGFVFRFAKDGE